MKCYKLTEWNYKSKDNRIWGEGIEHTTIGGGVFSDPCWIHAYSHPVLASLLNCIGECFTNPVLWEAESGPRLEGPSGINVATTRLKTIKIIPLPELTLEQKIKIALRCVLSQLESEEYAEWAQKWLDGSDRTRESGLRARLVVWEMLQEVHEERMVFFHSVSIKGSPDGNCDKDDAATFDEYSRKRWALTYATEMVYATDIHRWESPHEFHATEANTRIAEAISHCAPQYEELIAIIEEVMEEQSQ